MKTLYITGVSRGIGESIALNYLEKGWKVIGIGRKSSIQHENFIFLETDLADAFAVERLIFPKTEGKELILINNAGVLGEVSRIENQTSDQAQLVMQVNYIAPVQLIRKFLHEFSSVANKTIVNISSGAAQRPIPSWANYCASKAALNLFSETVAIELKETGNPCRVFAIAPGVVDTGMQKTIRSTQKEHFSSLANFKALKEEEKLFSPVYVAQKISELIENRTQIEEVIHRIS